MDVARALSMRRGLSILLAACLAPLGCSEDADDSGGQGGSGGTTSAGGAASGGAAALSGGAGNGDLGGAGPQAGSGSTGGGAQGSTGGAPHAGLLAGERLEVEGGAFPMGRGDAGSDACPEALVCPPAEQPEHEVTTSTFWLDRFEVSVERFREFYQLYPLATPAPGSGGHPRIAGSGWQADFVLDLPESQDELLEQLACAEDATFSATAGTRDAFPVNCVSWPLAFLFCLESGGRLPTEAEWEFAAAGGDENRLYPWGDDAADTTRASFFPGELGPVGEHVAGRGRYGQEDLAGSVWEWALDWLDTNWYSAGGAACSDCARVSAGTHRVLRGGAYGFEAITLRAVARSGDLPASSQASIGFRCAYDRPAE